MKADKKEAFITSNDGVKLAYETFGSDGPVVVLLHGAHVAVCSELGTGRQAELTVSSHCGARLVGLAALL